MRDDPFQIGGGGAPAVDALGPCVQAREGPVERDDLVAPRGEQFEQPGEVFAGELGFDDEARGGRGGTGRVRDRSVDLEGLGFGVGVCAGDVGSEGDLGVKTMARVMKKRTVDMRRTRQKVVLSGGAVRESVRRCMVALLLGGFLF